MGGTERVALSTLVSRLAAGELRPSDVVADALERLEATEPDIHAWVRVDREAALRAARELDSDPGAGPLRGIPVGVKDIIDVAGVPTECGSPLREGRIADADAWVVTRLRRAGAVPLGKTVTTEFAYFAPGPTRNPLDLGRTPGGSSSGSAAAVAAGVVPLALGSQTAGSLTRPASFCGVAAFVPPPGMWPTTGMTGLAHSLDKVGFLTPTVADLRLAYAVLNGVTRLPSPPEPPEQARLLVWRGVELVDVAEPMLTAVSGVVADAQKQGAVVRDLALPDTLPELVAAHETVMAYEAAQGPAAEARTPELLSEQLNDLLAQGNRIDEADYRAALETARLRGREVLDLLADADAILAPAAPGPAPEGLSSTGSPILSRPWHVLGLPVVTVPGCADSSGLPLGLQLIGHPDRIDRLFALGHWIEELIR